jgi:hypothetical protein
MGPRIDLKYVERRKCCHFRDSKSDILAVQPVASCHTEYATPVPDYRVRKLNQTVPAELSVYV